MYLLLVDPELFTSADLKELLEHAPAGSDIVNTYSAETLLTVAGKISPNIIIVDFDLVNEQADDLFNKLRDTAGQAHVLALIDPDHYEKLYKTIEDGGLDDYIVKPIRKEELMARVQIASRRKPMPAVDRQKPPIIEPADQKESEPALGEDIPTVEDPVLEQDDTTTGSPEFSFEDEVVAEVEEPDALSGEETPEDTAFISSLDEPEPEDLTVSEVSTEEEEFKIYEDPEISDMFEPDEDLEEKKDDIKGVSETAYSFDDVEPADDLLSKPDEPPVAGSQNEDQDFDFFDDFPEDKAQPAQSVESFFEEDDFSTEPLESKTDEKKEAAEGSSIDAFEETVADEEDPFDFSPDGDENTGKKQTPEDLFIKPVTGIPGKADHAKEDHPPAASTSAADESDSYFDELFAEEPPKREAAAKPEKLVDSEDLFGGDPFEAEPAAPQPTPPKHDLPGKSADDFLFGSSDAQVEDESYDRSRLKDFSFEDDDDEDDDDYGKSAKRGRKAGRKGSGGGFSRFLSIFGNILFVALLLMMATLSFFLIQSRISGGVPQVAGYQMYIVLSGSMAPEFDTGSLAFVKETPPEQVVVGDIITYRSSPGSDSLTTHRVVEVVREDGLRFVTRGDANNVNDPNPVLAESLVGRVTGSIPYLGYLLNFVQTRQGLILLIFIPGVLIIVYELGKILKYLTQSKKEEAAYDHQ